jgi:hypothetical protein
MAGGRTALATAAAMAVLATAAFGTAPLAHRDRVAGVPDEALRRLKVRAASTLKLPPLFSQVVDARMTGDSADHVEGTVVWRTVFGLRAGEIRVYGQHLTPRYEHRTTLAAWAAFLLTEAGLGVLLVRQLWDGP